MNLSPSDMKSLLYHILSGKEFGVERSGESLSRDRLGAKLRAEHGQIYVFLPVRGVPVLPHVQHRCCSTGGVQQEALLFIRMVLSDFWDEVRISWLSELCLVWHLTWLGVN